MSCFLPVVMKLLSDHLRLLQWRFLRKAGELSLWALHSLLFSLSRSRSWKSFHFIIFICAHQREGSINDVTLLPHVLIFSTHSSLIFILILILCDISCFIFKKRLTSFMELSPADHAMLLMKLINLEIFFSPHLILLTLEWYCRCISQFIIRHSFSGASSVRKSIPSRQLGIGSDWLFRWVRTALSSSWRLIEILFYSGQDSFDNILKKIQETIETPPIEIVEQRERKRSRSSPPQEIVAAVAAPVESAPAPVESAPAPIASEPVVESAPAPVVSAPEPVVSVPAPVVEAPAVVAKASAPVVAQEKPEPVKADSPAPSKKKEGK